MLTLLASVALTAPMIRLTIHADRPRQTIHNFGASDCWTVEYLNRWPTLTRNRVADLLFDKEKGAGLTGWRFNAGGGINHETINNPMRTIDTFETAAGSYDWSRCPGQRWMLKAATERGVKSVVLFANTPPARLTRSGKTNGTEQSGTTNLKAGAEAEFAKYLCDIAAHFRAQGVPIDIISPINEPDVEWNAGSQEGSRASNQDILRATRALSAEINKRAWKVRVLGPESNSIAACISKNWLSGKYKAEYGEYANLFVKEAEWRNAVKPIFAYHDYGSDGWAQLVDQRQKLKEAFKPIPDQEIWHTEYCQMNGPRGEGGWGRDLGMTLALNVGRLMQLDLAIVEVSAWQWWLGVSDGDYKDGLIYVDDLDKDDGPVYASKTLWTMGQFSRFVRPGYRRVEVEGPALEPGSVLTTAFRSPDSEEVVVVMVNVEGSTREVALNLEGYRSTAAYVTSERPGDDVRKMEIGPLDRALKVPSRSVMTILCRRGK